MRRIAVVGASGYTGVELLRLLSRHPDVQLVCVTSRQYVGRSVSEVFPSLQGSLDLVFEDVNPEGLAGRADLVFTAVPHQTAMGMIPQMLDAGCRVLIFQQTFASVMLRRMKSGTRSIQPKDCSLRLFMGFLSSFVVRSHQRG